MALEVVMDGIVRLDKWLWAARFFQDRDPWRPLQWSLARCASQASASSRHGALRVGERLSIQRGDESFDVVVSQLSAVRGPLRSPGCCTKRPPRASRGGTQAREVARLMKEPAAAIRGRPYQA